MNPSGKDGLKAPVYASLALAFASFGDAFLYAFLPANGIHVGISVVWVGILLSVNRFIRIASNTWMVHLFTRYGLRLVTIIAVISAIASTAGYAIATSVLHWLVFRISWGLSFSAMRISTLAYSLQQPQHGFSFGLTRSIQEAGPTIALILSPVLLSYFNYTAVFSLLAIISLPAFYFAWELPKVEDKIPPDTGRVFLKLPSILNAITFASSFLIDGIIVVVLGLMFLQSKENITLLTATTWAALYLGYRRICFVVFSPTGGWMADRIGLASVFNVSLGGMIIGLFLLVSGWTEAGCIIIFTFYSIHAAATPGNVSNGRSHRLIAVAENATSRDLGAAIGTLVGGVLLVSPHLTIILLITIFSLTLLLLIHVGTARSFLNSCTYGNRRNLH